MRGRPVRIRLPLASLLLLAACAADPRAGGSPGWNPVKSLTETSEDQERDLGMKFDAEVTRHLPMVDDPVVLLFLHDLGNDLLRRIPQQPFHYRFRVVQDPSLNAFAVPGGYIYFHTGTILAAASVDELAGVMAHEIGHVKGRHYARMREKSAVPELLTALAGIGAAVATQQSGAVVAAQGANEALKLHFTREFENEADQLGMDYMTRAGFDPTGMARFFERIVEQEKKENRAPGVQIPPYLFSHPDVEDRIVTVETLGPRMRPQIAADPSFEPRLREVQARLAVLADAKRGSVRISAPPRVPSSDLALAEADRLAAVEQPAAAVAVLERAEALAPADPRLPYRRGEILAQSGRPRDAIPAWKRALDLDPQQAMTLYRLGLACREVGDARSAIFYLEQAARRFGEKSELQKAARFEVKKLTWKPFDASGIADGSEERAADTVAGYARDRFTSRDEKVVWWGRLNPRYDEHEEDLRVRWRDPSGDVRREEPPVSLSGPVYASELPLRNEPDLVPGAWTVQVLLENDVVEERRFELSP